MGIIAQTLNNKQQAHNKSKEKKVTVCVVFIQILRFLDNGDDLQACEAATKFRVHHMHI